MPYQRINELVNQKRGITPSTALHLARYSDTTPDFWLNLRTRWDLYRTLKHEARDLETIQSSHVTATV